MTANKEADSNIIAAASTKDSQSQASCPAQCCMCGDYGVSNELFQCKVCRFRSQHRYCSNLYPKAESYQVCNWCLQSQRDEKDKSQNSSNSSSSNKINGQEEDDSKNVKNKKKNNDSNNNNSRVLLMKSQRSINLKPQQLNNKPIKKQRSPERSLPPPTPTPTPRARKRIITNGALEEKKLIKRKNSEEISNNNNNNNSNNSKNNTVTTVRRPFFRNKVRRYKLLDEVSS